MYIKEIMYVTTASQTKDEGYKTEREQAVRLRMVVRNTTLGVWGAKVDEKQISW